MDVMQPLSNTRVLDIGVTSDSTYRESNFFEKLYPYIGQIVCLGTENGSHLEAEYKGLRFRQVKSGEPLPFGKHEFDVAFSNAVLEHVGNANQQAAFIQDLVGLLNASTSPHPTDGFLSNTTQPCHSCTIYLNCFTGQSFLERCSVIGRTNRISTH
jgi:hypothetical protein